MDDAAAGGRRRGEQNRGNKRVTYHFLGFGFVDRGQSTTREEVNTLGLSKFPLHYPKGFIIQLDGFAENDKGTRYISLLK